MGAQIAPSGVESTYKLLADAQLTFFDTMLIFLTANQSRLFRLLMNRIQARKASQDPRATVSVSL
jgi:hypothetical protein